MRQSINYDDDDDDETNNGTTVGPILRGPLYKKDPDEVKRRSLIRVLLAVLVFLLVVAFFVMGRKEEDEATQVMHSIETVRKVPIKMCPQFCNARLEQRKKHHGGDFLKPDDLMELYETAKSDLVDDLRNKYGKYYDDIMLDNGEWRKGFTGVNKNKISSLRFQRKLKMKLLQMQLAIRSENDNLEGCNCNQNADSSPNRRLANKTVVLPEIHQTFTKFVWATGGHSAAAGHGNLFNETYTAAMEASVKSVFESVGIAFEGRSYAMGGMRSGPEFALCQESIFGLDGKWISL